MSPRVRTMPSFVASPTVCFDWFSSFFVWPMMLPPFPEQIPERFAVAWNRGDAEGIAALFTDDADFVNVVGLWWERRARIRQAHAIGLQTFFRDSSVTMERVKVRYVTEEVATVHARWRITGQYAPDSTTASPRTGIFVFVARRVAEGWICTTAQNTDIVPGKESIVVDDEGHAYGAAYTLPDA